MHYPLIEINLDKIKHNTAKIVSLCRKQGVDIAGVTKGACGSPQVAKAMLEGGVAMVSDSRLENIARLRDNGITGTIMLLRSPMYSQIRDVVTLVDISLNSELVIIKALSETALKYKRTHKVVLMIDIGDLREGILPEHALKTTQEILKLKGVILEGIGTNLTCYGGVIPTVENMNSLVEIAENIEKKNGIKLNIISGGNTSSLRLVKEKRIPKRINHLRIGEGILLGTDTVDRSPLQDTCQDCFVLKAEIIELNDKPTVPKGKIGQDAFGQVPEFEDKGVRRRAIIGIGKEDIDISNLVPTDHNISILGASSDHLLVDIDDCKKEYAVGRIISFVPDYKAMMAAMTSAYVTKRYVTETKKEKVKSISIIGAPFNFGCDFPGVDLAPEYIRNIGLVKALENLDFTVNDLGNIKLEEVSSSKKKPRVKHLDEVIAVCETVAEKVAEIIQSGSIPLILGGDHSITIGVQGGIRSVRKNTGLIFFDAHGDFNTEKTSPSHNAHGMVVSSCVGLADSALAKTCGICPKIEQENIVIIGLRDLDPKEKVNLKKSRIHVFTMEDIDLLGMREVVSQAIEMLSHCADGVHVSLDMDVIDGKDAPGVSLPVNGGISYREAHMAMEILFRSELVNSMDIVEVNPNNDIRNFTSRLAMELSCSLFGKRIM